MKPGVPEGIMIAEISGRPSSPVPVRAVTVTTEVIDGAGVGDERLGAVDDPLAVVEHRLGARGTRVAAGIRLGEPETRERAAGDQVGQEALLLGLAAVGEDRVDAQAHPGRQRDADRLVDPAELLDRDAQAGERAAVGGLERPAELLGHDQAEQAEVAHRRHEVGGEVVLAVPLGDVRLDRLGGELADHLAEVLVVLAQLVHRRSFAQAVPSPGRGARQSVGFLTLTST